LGISVTYCGHSWFSVEIHRINLHFNPHINPGEFASETDLNSIPVDHILLTHRHVERVTDTEDVACEYRSEGIELKRPDIGKTFNPL
jgi:L-ascorbate metabolism protein UlaG (beta-lactamase superfamily)